MAKETRRSGQGGYIKNLKNRLLGTYFSASFLKPA
jgi:hypothetical protein